MYFDGVHQLRCGRALRPWGTPLPSIRVLRELEEDPRVALQRPDLHF